MQSGPRPWATATIGHLFSNRTGRAGRRMAVVAAVSMTACLLLRPGAPVSASSPVHLVVSQAAAFGFLGHSCGGIQEQAFATGFDAGAGYPAGNVSMQTRCGGSGRGGGYKTTTYSAWAACIWDLTGVSVSTTLLAATPTTDPALTAFDANGNEVYNAGNQAYLQLAPGYVPAPRVTGLSLSQGPAAGGTSLTITGTGFTNATSVTFGTGPAGFTVTNDNSITAITPSSPPGPVSVTVSSAGGPSAGAADLEFTFVAAPSVTSITPPQGPVTGGTSVTITGSGLSPAGSVTFDGIPAAFSVVDDSTLTVTSPAGENPDTVRVVVSSPGGTSGGGPASQFTYTGTSVPQPPSVTRVTPSHGPTAGGTRVTILGRNLGQASAVNFGSARARRFVVLSATSIRAVAPAGHGTVRVRVRDGAGQSAGSRAATFRYKG